MCAKHTGADLSLTGLAMNFEQLELWKICTCCYMLWYGGGSGSDTKSWGQG